MRPKPFDHLIGAMLLLGGLGLWYGRRVSDPTEIFARDTGQLPVPDFGPVATRHAGLDRSGGRSTP